MLATFYFYTTILFPGLTASRFNMHIGVPYLIHHGVSDKIGGIQRLFGRYVLKYITYSECLKCVKCLKSSWLQSL